jgi:hypothetical protein
MYSDVIPRGAFSALTIFVAVGAMIARVVVQKKAGDD